MSKSSISPSGVMMCTVVISYRHMTSLTILGAVGEEYLVEFGSGDWVERFAEVDKCDNARMALSDAAFVNDSSACQDVLCRTSTNPEAILMFS